MRRTNNSIYEFRQFDRLNRPIWVRPQHIAPFARSGANLFKKRNYLLGSKQFLPRTGSGGTTKWPKQYFPTLAPKALAEISPSIRIPRLRREFVKRWIAEGMHGNASVSTTNCISNLFTQDNKMFSVILFGNVPHFTNQEMISNGDSGNSQLSRSFHHRQFKTRTSCRDYNTRQSLPKIS